MSISQAVSANSIKPIETLWKGYRFRSRLEARWAVFFETLGLKWEYEPQGFELCDGTRYLPDFYLPDQESYIEIKPAIDYKPKLVYMAGKIQNPDTDWRSTISWMYPTEDHKLPGYHTYVGPYPLMGRCHGNAVPCTHAALYTSGFIDEDEVYQPFSDVNEVWSDFDPQFVVDRCFSGIDRCDVLFAWIDTLDCYGTLAEIGYAKGKGKQIFLGISEDLVIPASNFNDNSKPHNTLQSHDLWFVETMAHRAIRSKSPRQAFDKLLVDLPESFKKIRQLKNGILIAGNPHPGEYTAYQGNECGALFLLKNKIFARNYWEDQNVVGALSYARAARFEHGERP